MPLPKGGKARPGVETEARKPALDGHPAWSRGVTRHGLFRRGDIERCVFARTGQGGSCLHLSSGKRQIQLAAARMAGFTGDSHDQGN